jgi:hypothetical protein
MNNLTASAQPEMDIVGDHTFFRRVRSGVCASLRVGGEPMTLAGFAAAGIHLKAGVNNELRLGKLVLRCTEKHDTVGTGYVADVCTSSWHCACPWAPPAAVVRLPAPVNTLAARILAVMTARKLTQSAVGTGIGYSRKVVNNALSGVRKGSDVLEAIAAYLGIS